MKKSLFSFVFITLSSFVWSQNILFVDDNDNITDNTDTVLLALQNTNYSSFDYYNIADSANNPSINLMNAYDLVIWYASTDGVGLGFWDAGVNGDSDLKNYLINGGRLWVIGSDLLYAGGYNTPNNFAAVSFVYDFMGLESYDVQSYGDDLSVGVSQVNSLLTAPNYFPSTLNWIFSTLWWVDGVTSRTSATDIYEMGPLGYALYQKVTMTHFKDIETNVLSTLFDPALISTTTLREDFIEKSIFYLLNFDLGLSAEENFHVKVSPNPVHDELKIDAENGLNYTIRNMNGQEILSGILQNKTIAVQHLTDGMYFLTINGITQKISKL